MFSQGNNIGGVGLRYTYFPDLADAQCHQGGLWIDKPVPKGPSSKPKTGIRPILICSGEISVKM
jgi:hypothetical protein